MGGLKKKKKAVKTRADMSRAEAQLGSVIFTVLSLAAPLLLLFYLRGLTLTTS